MTPRNDRKKQKKTKPKKKNVTKRKSRAKGENEPKAEGKRSQQAGRRHAETETDGQRQQDKKPHHLLLYLLDLISGVNNIGQKYKTKQKQDKRKKEKKKQGNKR